MTSGRSIAKSQHKSGIQIVYFDSEPAGVILPVTVPALHIGSIIERDGLLYEVWYEEDDGAVSNFRAERKMTAEEFFAKDTN